MKKHLVFVLAPDSFKESMTAKEACDAMELGIRKVDPNITCIQVPMADGGEGTMQSLVDATNGHVFRMNVTGPLGGEVEACFGILGDGETGVLEMAGASGIHLVPPAARNPLVTTTYGTGQLIKACLDRGVKKLLIGIGGSATNDGGAGVLQALGGRLFDQHGQEIGYGGGELGQLDRIDLTGLDPRLLEVQVEVACDVTSPLCGPEGASYVFGPQKGANAETAGQLDRSLNHYANVIREQLGKDLMDVPGAGAAGGLGYGLMVFLDGRLHRGVDLVIKYTGLEEMIKEADMVWTGEGSLDFQTQYGKTPLGVAAVAKKHNKPVVALAGRVGEDIEMLYEKGIDSVFGIMKEAGSIEEALMKGRENIEKTAESIVRFMYSTQGLR
ncbi:glycerate kinase [Paenibacillus sp. HN-1]|uniref:glycerate kinase family protein n=1 Tax=Paenibacillus TaxID=44249 RepID=UPI001CA974B2|nr:MULTISPECIES: glycerate kinase [Paenibacillus]MBY9081395.1 glycerate kinase [Paenibacillus sp. CGMCC 1.18879]MBY9084915.1 glycerate kinase [Paenibacillus sinensis]